MDILGPLPETERGNRYVLVIADNFTKWTEAFPMSNMEAHTVAELFVYNFAVSELLIICTLTRAAILNPVLNEGLVKCVNYSVC